MQIHVPLRIALCIILLLCLLDMPYGYYAFVRLSASIGFGILAWWAYQAGTVTDAVIYGVLLLLFQPLYKVYLGRELWQWVDVGVACWLGYGLWKHRKENSGV